MTHHRDCETPEILGKPLDLGKQTCLHGLWLTGKIFIIFLSGYCQQSTKSEMWPQSLTVSISVSVSSQK